MRILVVEDEKRIADFLSRGLQGAGYAVDTASTGGAALDCIHSTDYDLVVLDLMLPDMDGLQVMEKVRNRKLGPPVLILSARGALDDRVKGLELGADDYLVKPFAFVELLARIRTLLRRGPVREAEQLVIGDLEIDAIKRRVRRAGTRIDLTPKEFSLLHLLARKRGELLSRTQIASYVWDMNFDSDTNVVEVAVRRLRAKVDDPFTPKLIHTVRGMGYVLDTREP
jgi:two-component system copper resistance phosphate regulon response regulator CusR